MLDLLRQLAETVDQLRSKCIDVALVLYFGQASVERESHRQVCDVFLGNEQRRADGDLRRPAVGGRRRNARLQTHHGLFQHLLIEFVADFLDVTGLLFAEQIAGATNVEIVRRKLETRAERIERLQDLEPALGLWRDLLLRWQREEREGAQLRAPDPA